MLRNPLRAKSGCPWGKEEKVRDLEILVFLNEPLPRYKQTKQKHLSTREKRPGLVVHFM